EFTISHARVSFLGYEAAKSDVALRFRESTQGIEVSIVTSLSDWTFSTSFPSVEGWPFDGLLTNPPAEAPTFVFTTEVIDDWNSTGVRVAKGQNFVGTVGVPAVLGPTSELIKGLGPLGPQYTIGGPITIDAVSDGEDDIVTTDGDGVVLYPDMYLRGVMLTET